MKTTIEIESDLIEELMQRGNFKTKSAAVHKALENYLNKISRDKLAALSGKVIWEGDLNEMRID